MPSLPQILLLAAAAVATNLVCLATAATKPSSGCGKSPPTLTAGGNHTLTVNDKSRWYLLNLPAAYNNTHPYRLIFTLHAAGGNSSMVAAGQGGYLPWYGLPPYTADSLGAIYVAPNGLDRGWANRGGEDVTLISEIARSIKSDFCVDESLVFSVGFSYGASMSYALACGMAEQFRAVAVQSGGNMSGCATGTLRQPVALYGQHGVDGDLNITTARAIRDQFVAVNGCQPSTTVAPAVGSGSHTKVEYQGCKEGYPVTWIEYDGGHTPQPRDKGQTVTFAAEETWKFFGQFK
ncbi:hypothetical protein B0H66DRAFT_519587 [Apodospora peruviana]|uniref:Feruloyl esterase C n=1 Tax=Apodospora peruviana TaxID=516989 RepID=A0AAE0I0Z4_9PEZI|nr:hypothetical protein B0H66DRAFT_519587 [Apodospora peruviana]